MNYRPNPLMYGANKGFLSTFRLDITMGFQVDRAILARAVAGAMKRYPYFSIRPVRRGEDIILEFNPRPVPVFPDDRTVTLGTDESDGHLLVFGCAGRRIFLHASHYIADGSGIMPLVKTVLYLYVSEVFGDEGLDKAHIRTPEDPVCEGEYVYPFPDTPMDNDTPFFSPKTTESVYSLDPEAFDADGLYAYHLQIPQKTMMEKAQTSDASPISFLSVMLYRALCRLDPGMEMPVVGHVQHQYRAALGMPMSHHSLVSYIPVQLPPKAKGWHVEKQNTTVRGQIILGSERSSDIEAVNRLVDAWPGNACAAFAQRHKAMADYAENSIRGKTFGISYMGKVDWSGLDRYVEELHAFIGEKGTGNMLLIEVMTVGGDFSITFMQSGRGRRYLDTFIEEIRSFDIPVRLRGEGRYSLCDTAIPENAIS